MLLCRIIEEWRAFVSQSLLLYEQLKVPLITALLNYRLERRKICLTHSSSASIWKPTSDLFRDIICRKYSFASFENSSSDNHLIKNQQKYIRFMNLWIASITRNAKRKQLAHGMSKSLWKSCQVKIRLAAAEQAKRKPKRRCWPSLPVPAPSINSLRTKQRDIPYDLCNAASWFRPIASMKHVDDMSLKQDWKECSK